MGSQLREGEVWSAYLYLGKSHLYSLALLYRNINVTIIGDKISEFVKLLKVNNLKLIKVKNF